MITKKLSKTLRHDCRLVPFAVIVALIRINKEQVRVLLLMLAFLLLRWPIASAQQPGGVSGTKAWFISVYDPVQRKYYWKDISNHGITLATSLRGLNINFHSAARFEGVSHRISLPGTKLSQATFIGIFYPQFPLLPEGNIYSIRFNNKEVFSFLPGHVKGGQNLDYKPDLTNTRPEDRSASMKTAAYYMSAGRDNFSVWGENKASELTMGFQGYAPEMIIYNRVLSPLERIKVESYLAIKYGITLSTSYMGSNGEILWNKGDPRITEYHNRVCGIGRDDASGLSQLRSHTTYEEQPEFSFSRNSNGIGDLEGSQRFIPSSDSTSLHRSLTIGFVRPGATPKNNSYLFWGDNAKSIKPQDFFEDQAYYPAMQIVQRRWLLFNRENIAKPTRVEVSGELHPKLYDPYDYLAYRYVLIKFKNNSNQVDTTYLFSYFGRKIFKPYNFYNSKIVWDSIKWSHNNTDPYHYFGFGKVPLMRLVTINNIPATIRKRKIIVPVESGLPISSQLRPDTIKVNFNSQDRIKLAICFTQGIEPYSYVLQKLTPSGLITVAKAKLRSQQLTPIGSQAAPPAQDPSLDTGEGETAGVDSDVLEKRATRGGIKYSFQTAKLEPQSYLITITDRVNQKIIVPVTITQMGREVSVSR